MDLERKNRKDKLLEYYKLSQTNDTRVDPTLSLDSSDFDYNAYLKKILKEENLSNLMDKEKELMGQIRGLDSEMQTLVYDNYNKFIYATDTIKNMKSDFQFVEEEMGQLGAQIGRVEALSRRLQETLSPRRSELQRLSGTRQLLTRLEYLLELPRRLREDVEAGHWSRAVRAHARAQTVLDRYRELPAFGGIRSDCDTVIARLKNDLTEKFHDPQVDVQQLSTASLILLQLGEPRLQLAQRYLAHCEMVTLEAFSSLRQQLKIDTDEDDPFIPDILHFANITTELVLDRLTSQIAVYTELFLQPPAATDEDQLGLLTHHDDPLQDTRRHEEAEMTVEELNQALLDHLEKIMEPFLAIVQKRLSKEQRSQSGDTAMLARAMDRVHSRLQALNKLLPLPQPAPTGGAGGEAGHKKADLAGLGLQLVCDIAHDRCLFYHRLLARQLGDCVTDVRQRLAAAQLGSGGALVTSSAPPAAAASSAVSPANSVMVGLLHSLSDTLVDQLKAALNGLQAFIDTDNTFSKKLQFQTCFCLRDIRETLFVGFLNDLVSCCNDLAKQSSIGASSCPLLLILGRLCQNWADLGVVDYLLTLVEEQFLIGTIRNHDSSLRLTSVESLTERLRQCSLELVNAYVRVQGNSLSQMVRKSVDTRDWLNCVEPRSVRSVMKRLVEDMAQIDIQVSQLLPTNQQRGGGDHSSDNSSRRPGYRLHQQPQPQQPQVSSVTGSRSNRHSSDRFLSNISKLFAEKIRIFAPVVAIRESVLTGIVRIVLKTFMECVRLRTFGKFGLQQVQVDCRYLQIHLWRFVSDEKLIHTLLDDVVGSVVNRCVDPVYMDDSIIERVCES